MTYYGVVETEHGFVGLAQVDGKLWRSTLPTASRVEALRQATAGLATDAVEDIAALGCLPEKIQRYFAGEHIDFSDVKVDLSVHGPFHATALRACREVPYGSVVSYGELARLAGSVRAARAAGSAMARNRTPIVVPCHRVLASGGLGGFGAGLEWKRTLLRLEGVII